MRYIIDGYNLIFQICTKVDPLQKTRESIIVMFQTIVQSLNLNTTIIFDSHKEHSEHFSSKKHFTNLEIIFPPEGQSADDYIIEILEFSLNTKIETLVTSDQPLALKARSLGAKTQSIDKFLAYLTCKLNKNIEEKPQIKETDTNISRLRKIFEQRLRDHQDINGKAPSSDF